MSKDKGDGLKYPQSDADAVGGKKTRLEIMQAMHKAGMVSNGAMRDAAFGTPTVSSGLADRALMEQAKILKGLGPPGTLASGEPVDEEVDMAPGSVARRIVDIAARQAKFEIAKEDTLLGEMCEMLHKRLIDSERSAELMIQHMETLQKENQRLRAQNLKLTDLVLDKLGVPNEDHSARREGSQAHPHDPGGVHHPEGRGHRSSEEEEP